MVSKADLTLNDILRVSSQHKLPLLICGFAGLCMAAVLLFLLTPQYEAKMILAPALQDYKDINKREDSRYSNLVKDPHQNDVTRPFVQFEQIFREASVAEKLTSHVNFLSSVNKDSLFRFGGQDISNASEFSDYLKCKVKIRPLGGSASRLITYRHPDPLFAVQLLQALQIQTDDMIRKQVQERAGKRITFLQAELQNAINPEHRQALADLIVAEEQQRMLSSMDAPYAAEIIEPPSVSLKKSFPKPGVFLPVGFVLGLLLGLMRILIKAQ